MNLAKIWRARIATSEEAVPDMRSRMCIALYAVSCDELYQFAARLAETMSGAAGDRHHCASEDVHLMPALRPLWSKSAAFAGNIG